MRLRVRKWEGNDLIFCTGKGTPMYHNWFIKKVNGKSLGERIAEAAGVRYVSEHTLRKIGATVLEAELHAPRQVVQAALRHKRQNVTDVYVKYDAESLRPWIEKLAAVLPTTCPQTQPILADTGVLLHPGKGSLSRARADEIEEIFLFRSHGDSCGLEIS